jgi:hypothetical protein
MAHITGRNLRALLLMAMIQSAGQPAQAPSVSRLR